MESTLAQVFGINEDLFHWVIVPILIFFARICDVSINTVRTLFVMSGRRNIAPLIGFVEALIWLIAIQQIMQNLGSFPSYIAYAGGFAAGVYTGMRIEEKLAYGKVIVRVITQKSADALLGAIKTAGYGLTVIDAEGSRGKVAIILTVVKRDQLKNFISIVHQFNPNAFYTVENVRYATERMSSPYSDINEAEMFGGRDDK